MGDPAVRRATYDDVLASAPHTVAQVIDGHLDVQPRPAGHHALAASALGAELYGPFQRGRGGPGGWIVLDEPELHLGEDILVPDLAGWRRERMSAVPATPYFSLAPDWVCEILSPSTARLDRGPKLRIYAREQVAHAWLIDPALRMLEVYLRRDERWLLLATYQDDALVRAEPFDAVEFDLGALWVDAAR